VTSFRYMSVLVAGSLESLPGRTADGVGVAFSAANGEAEQTAQPTDVAAGGLRLVQDALPADP
jgi:hypothetical protein